MRGGKFSKSRGAAVDVPYFLSKYDPDPLRFYLTATAPETRDTPTAVLVGGFRRAQQPCPACTCRRSKGERQRGERAGSDTFATLSAGLGEEPGHMPRLLWLSLGLTRFDDALADLSGRLKSVIMVDRTGRS